MEKSYYIVTFKPEYLALLRSIRSEDSQPDAGPEDRNQRAVVCITQGGFGQDVVDDDLQLKERFLEYLFSAEDIDFPRTPALFDQYFTLERAGEFIDLDYET